MREYGIRGKGATLKEKGPKKISNEDLIVDPYETISEAKYICTLEDHARKKNCAKNPWCLYGLGEKEGIWKSDDYLLSAAGADPTLLLRTRGDLGLVPPAGLRNLGATCYLNVLVQSLFHNLLVQDSVFNMLTDTSEGQAGQAQGQGQEGQGTGTGVVDVEGEQGDQAMGPVMRELQAAFAHMKLGLHGSVDLNTFIGKC
ncbi:hypothetical protein B484DRAFT_258914 [Ochromonadaceae sp. CCMP2298]|nr:hypothetical protein B484DRAFT_258914 [Ochromonadaceae sp. CCMP2298]